MLQNRPDAEEQKVQHCCSSADITTRVLAATDLHLLIGTLLLGSPKWQVLGVTSPHFPLQPRFTAAKEPSQQVQGC